MITAKELVSKLFAAEAQIRKVPVLTDWLYYTARVLANQVDAITKERLHSEMLEYRLCFSLETLSTILKILVLDKIIDLEIINENEKPVVIYSISSYANLNYNLERHYNKYDYFMRWYEVPRPAFNKMESYETVSKQKQVVVQPLKIESTKKKSKPEIEDIPFTFKPKQSAPPAQLSLF